jgi:hypothetical protein
MVEAPRDAALYVIGGLVVAAGLAFWEITRRKSPTVLVPHGGKIAIYRKGKLSEVTTAGAITRYVLHPFNTIRMMMAPVVVTGVSAAGLLGMFSSKGGPPQGLFLLGVAWGVALGVSLVRTRIRSPRYKIPHGGGTEEVMLRGMDADRLFGRR